MALNPELIAARREGVIKSYDSAVADNHTRFLENDEKATSEYIYHNQKEDAFTIVQKFIEDRVRVVSITKKTKVGMDGLMIEIAKQMCTHPDDSVVVNPASVRILTGMNNAGWEKDMKEKAPTCFKNQIFHHGQLKHAELKDIKNALIIVDEIDTGDNEDLVLHSTFDEAGLLDVEYMEQNNIRFVFASATMIKEQYDMARWGTLHAHHRMAIPADYIGHSDFMALGIIQEFYSLATPVASEKWVQEDVIDHYGTDFRVHIARVNTKTVRILQEACIKKRVRFCNHTSSDRMTKEEIREIFMEPLHTHIVIAVKGFFRRANLIPNKWKLRIGATHELFTHKVDNNVQIQGLPGRMTGYWRSVIEGGHKTGPYRTSIKAVQQYEEAYLDPFGNGSYQTAGLTKKNGSVTKSEPTMVTHTNITGLVPVAVASVVATSDLTKSVPIVIQVTAEDYKTIVKNKVSWDLKSVHRVIQKYSSETYDRIKDMKKNQVQQPESDHSYEKRIVAFVNAAERNALYTWTERHINQVDTDTYQVYLDNRCNRVIVSIYYGSRLATV